MGHIKVLLGYLVYTVVSTSNAVGFIRTYTNTKETMGDHFKNHIYKQVENIPKYIILYVVQIINEKYIV